MNLLAAGESDSNHRLPSLQQSRTTPGFQVLLAALGFPIQYVMSMQMNAMTKSAILSPFNLLHRIDSKLATQLLFRAKTHYALNLESPKTFNEKLQWIKFNDKNPLMPVCSDKYAVREHLKEKGFERFLPHLLWEGQNPEEIPFSLLPKKFVIKATHGSSFNLICTDKSRLDRKKAVRLCKRWLSEKYIPCYGEWYYGIVQPRIIIEEYLEGEAGQPPMDYKVFVFNGQAKLISVYSDRGEDCKQDLFDTEWNRLSQYEGTYKRSEKIIDKPSCLPQMLQIAEALGKDFNHVRVDFYVVSGRLYFSEMTFTSSAGFSRYGTYSLDEQMGAWLSLPQCSNAGTSGLQPKKEKRVYFACKEVFDIVFSLFVLIAFSWLFLACAVVIKLDDPKAPAIFIQERIGCDGRRFRMYKFRTMRPDAESMKAELRCLNEKDGPVFKIEKDPRITKPGRLLRKLSLDELPQFVNVIKGDMSVVGPRPALPIEVASYNDHQRKRLTMKPGMTCYWQTRLQRDSISFDEWVDLDLLYAKKCGFWTDFKLIIQTIGCVLAAQGR